MCGVLGLASRDPLAELHPQRHLDAVLGSLRHRGPDSCGQYKDANVWLGHTRLSIIDLSDAARQPMESEDGRYVISYNGETYNFRELAKEHDFRDLRSNSDTEVVLRLFAKLGPESLARLNGMFAFAVYDRQQRDLWLVRDRLGIKPLYFSFSGASIAFASELKALRVLSSTRAICNLSAVHEWLYYGNCLGGRTLYEGIQQLLPGSYLKLNLQSFSFEMREYWSLLREVERDEPRKASKLERTAVAETRRLLEQAVARQIVSDVPVGIFLSGGVDSSAIAAFASRHYEGSLSTYSVGFDFADDGGELPKARRIAELYGTDHHEIFISGEHVGELVEKMVVHHDAPFSDAANIPLYLMAARISASTKVVLQGDGGDELFGGYRRYTSLQYHHLLHPIARLLQTIPSAMPESVIRQRVERYLRAFAAPTMAETSALLLTAEDPASNPSEVFLPSVRKEIAQVDPFARVREIYEQARDQDTGNRMSLVDLLITLPDIYLEKVDRSTMAASLEVRVPFLDNDLVSYVARLPGGRKMPFGKKKWLLKAALRGVVPDDVLFAKKRGFSVPYGYWLRSSLKPLFFDQLAAFEKNHPTILNVRHVREMYSRTESGRQNHSSVLWKILNFMIWTHTSNIEFQLS